jgi:NitT/TauT family transport system substrate-binding protein
VITIIRPKQLAVLGASLAIAALSIAGCSSSGSSSTSSSSADANSGNSSAAITVQEYPGNSTSWMTYIAIQKGYFKQAGLNVQLQSLTTGTTATAAMIGGSLDIGLIDLFNVGPLLVQGQQLVDLVEQVKIGQVLIAAPGVSKADLSQTFPLKTPASVGAASVAGASALEVRYLQQAFGGNASDVKIVADITGAGLKKSIEPYLYANPNVACTFEAQGATEVGSLASANSSYPAAVNVMAGLPDNGYWALNSWVTAHKSQATAFQQAVIKATQWATSHVAQAAQILRASQEFNLTTLSSSQFSTCVQGISGDWSTGLTSADVAKWQTVLRTEGAIPASAVLPPVAKWTLTGAVNG